MSLQLCPLLILLFVSSVFVMPISAFNDLLGQHDKTTRKGFRLDLRHRDSGKNLGKHELLKRALQREKVRLQWFKATTMTTTTTTSSSSAQAPLYSNWTNGEYETIIGLGTPLVPLKMIMDTGSDLTWTQSKACNPCFEQPSVPFDPTSSSTYKLVTCNDTACTSLPSYSCNSNNSCKYDYSYGGGLDQQGLLGRDTLSVPNGTYSGFLFGVETYYQGAVPEVDGILGCGGGPQSIVSQLSVLRNFSNVFSYCLVPAGSLSMGGINVGLYKLPNNVGNVIKTPMDQVNCDASTFTCVTITAVSVGNKELNAASSFRRTGGCIIDSGTTLTYLPSSVYDFIEVELTSKAIPSLEPIPLTDTSSEGFSMCWKQKNKFSFPDIALIFSGNQKMVIHNSSYLFYDTYEGKNVTCTVFANGFGNPFNIIGNLVSQKYIFINDFDKKTVTIAGPTDCSKF
ncbi:hypothetical protein Droror1_Dr00025011 [Drosera rotundifolia]